MNIYVGNLSYNVDEEDLRKLFEQYGEVKSAKLIMDKETNSSKGFGFVEMEDKEGAKKALERLNGSEVNGKRIKVNIARPKKNNYRKNF
jgi:RNA recognition motif-containing protein